MNERSRVTMSTASGRSLAFKCRRLNRSMGTRRGSCRSFSATLTDRRACSHEHKEQRKTTGCVAGARSTQKREKAWGEERQHLPPTDIDAVDSRRAVLKKTVREAPRGES
jgi:hypothetical protein